LAGNRICQHRPKQEFKDHGPFGETTSQFVNTVPVRFLNTVPISSVSFFNRIGGRSMTRAQDSDGHCVSARHVISAIVPTTWTGEQAHVIIGFLEEILSIIWERYEDDVFNVLEGTTSTSARSQIEGISHHPVDEDIPF
jgi:hypothetical protein